MTGEPYSKERQLEHREPEKITERTMLNLLRARYSAVSGNGPRWAFVTHVRDRAGFDATRTLEERAVTPTTDPIVAAITVLEHVTINDPSGRPDTEDAHNRVRLALGYLEIAHKELRVRTAEAILAKSLMTAEQDERYARLRPGAIGRAIYGEEPTS